MNIDLGIYSEKDKEHPTIIEIVKINKPVEVEYKYIQVRGNPTTGNHTYTMYMSEIYDRFEKV